MKVVVVGLGTSGIAACNVLRDIGSAVKATDIEPAEEASRELRQLADRGVEIELGRHSIDFALDCDLMVVSPGVPLDIDILRWAKSHGKMVISEVELAYCLSDAKFVAVTGTNGKTTTVSLLGRILSEKIERVRVGGNIGAPISAIAYRLGSDWTLVTEVSSFQLDTCVSFRPRVSVLLNITPDHLDRYPSYEAYVRSKARLFANQEGDDVAIVNYDDGDCVQISTGLRCRRLFFSTRCELDEGAFVKGTSAVVRLAGKTSQIFSPTDLNIRGRHNLYNSLAASLAAVLLDVAPEAIREIIRDFRGLEHRLEPVATVRGVEFINDSKATNVDSVMRALEATATPIILIAGGKDKGADFEQVAPLIREKVKYIFAIGEAREKIEKAFSHITQVRLSSSLEETVRLALDAARPGDTVLLSPGCASFDMFKDFEHRGKVFKKAVIELNRRYEATSNG